ncbi:MAG: LysR family transcriptional regulator [Bacteriovoracaceae bacterium]
MSVRINNLGLSAFHQCALLQNMTEAAKVLGVSQSALSQRISQLEDDLETTLFLREGKKLILTEMGEEILSYCRVQENLENELFSKIGLHENELGGVIRIAGFSSIMRSIVMKRLSGFVRENQSLRIDLQTYEVIDLFDALKKGKADFILTDYEVEMKGIKKEIIGQEEYVVIESSKYKTHSDVFLDHGPHDNATESFLKAQGKAIKPYRRSYLGEVYAIIDGVENGFGRAVMSRHLIENNKKVKIIKGYKKYFRPLCLYYFDKPYYSEVFKQTLIHLKN